MEIPVEYELPPRVQGMINKVNEHVQKGYLLIVDGKMEKGHAQLLEAKKIMVELEVVHGITLTYRGDI